MEKTEQKGGIAKFQSESKNMYNNPKVLNEIIQNMSEKIDELQAKAEAYDRLMSGGKKTPKEVANFLNRIIAMDADHKWHAFASIPWGKSNYRWIAIRGSSRYRVPCFNIEFDGDWEQSVTMPDVWEAK